MLGLDGFGWGRPGWAPMPAIDRVDQLGTLVLAHRLACDLGNGQLHAALDQKSAQFLAWRASGGQFRGHLISPAFIVRATMSNRSDGAAPRNRIGPPRRAERTMNRELGLTSARRRSLLRASVDARHKPKARPPERDRRHARIFLTALNPPGAKALWEPLGLSSWI
jgi:hypothetical protein